MRQSDLNVSLEGLQKEMELFQATECELSSRRREAEDETTLLNTFKQD